MLSVQMSSVSYASRSQTRVKLDLLEILSLYLCVAKIKPSFKVPPHLHIGVKDGLLRNFLSTAVTRRSDVYHWPKLILFNRRHDHFSINCFSASFLDFSIPFDETPPLARGFFSHDVRTLMSLNALICFRGDEMFRLVFQQEQGHNID